MSDTLKHMSAALLAGLVEEHVAKLVSTLRPDYLAALKTSYATEENERGREVLEQLLANAEIAATGGFPLCQDTGYVWVCLEVFDESLSIPANVFSGVDAAVARAAEAAGMRMSIVRDALVDRINTGSNTPALCELVLHKALDSHSGSKILRSAQDDRGVSTLDEKELSAQDDRGVSVQDDEREPSQDHGGIFAQDDKVALSQDDETPPAILHIMLKGGGSDNASALTMLAPGAGIEGVLDFVVNRVAEKGANACPPLVIGVGVGGSFDKVAGLAKHALLREVGSVHPHKEIAALEEELLGQINALGIGPGGLGGSTTALAVHIESAPCHIAALPVAVNIGCTALRSVSIPL